MHRTANGDGKAVELIRESKGELLMKGTLRATSFLRAVTSPSAGLRRRASQPCLLMDVPTYPETVFITDAAINIFPSLEVKRDVIQNAIDLFTDVGLGTPRVAIFAAVETVTPKIPSTIDAAALCRWRIAGHDPAAYSTARSRSTMRLIPKLRK